MGYKCYDSFLVRTPGLPIEYLKQYQTQEKDIYEFITKNKELDSFFRKALAVSSNSLYQSYINKPIEKKKYEHMKEALLKFFLRSTLRTTPYGYFATVSMGRFGEKDIVITNRKNIELKADGKWVSELIYKLEKEESIFKKLSFKVNPICYRSGNRFKNPYYTNHGTIDGDKEKISENSIRYTKLLDLLCGEAKEFITFEKLFAVIKSRYSEIGDLAIIQTIQLLVDNEYLLSSLRLPTFCDNSMEHIYHMLEDIGYKGYYIEKLKYIIQLMEEYREKEDVEILIRLYENMSEICKSKTYIMMNVGRKVLECQLPEEVKYKIEKFADFWASYATPLNPIKEFVKKFEESYGTDVEVPFLEIIDKNRFDGTENINLYFPDKTEKEKKFEKTIGNLIFKAILEQKEEINITKDHLALVEKKDTEVIKAFDLNFFICKEEGKYQLTLGPNIGDDNVGAMFQRFYDCLERKEIKKYNEEVYQLEKEIYEKEYELVEVREAPDMGRINNIINSRSNYRYYIAFGNVEKKESTDNILDLDDLYVGIDNWGKCYIKSNKLGRKIKIVSNNMLNPECCNPVVKLLRGISQSYEESVQVRLNLLRNEILYKYVPRIKCEGIVITPRTWYLDEDDFIRKDYQGFKQDLQRVKKEYKIDQKVYLEEADHRLFLDLDQEEFIHILYLQYKKAKRVRLCEVENSFLKNSFIKDEEGNSYIGEFVFSFLAQEVHSKEINQLPYMRKLCTRERIKTICEDGWIYFKLYGTGNRTNEIITRELPELQEELNGGEHFFIRYVDKQGWHLRVRFKFADNKQAFCNLSIIGEWSQKMLENHLINCISYDMYEREINRYGGEEIISDCETVFFKDSYTVEKLLRQNDIEDEKNIEKGYIFGIVTILKYLTYSMQEAFDVIDCQKMEQKYRDLYRKHHEEYMQMVQDIYNEQYNTCLKISEVVADEKQALLAFREKMQYQLNKKSMTNSKENVILSIVHMFCNRFNGNREYEYKYSEIVRNAMYHILERQNKEKRSQNVDK